MSLNVSGLHAQVLSREAGSPARVSGAYVQVLRSLTPPNIEVSSMSTQVLIRMETVSIGDPMISVRRKIPDIGWWQLRPKRLH